MTLNPDPNLFWSELSPEVDSNARRRIEKVCDETGQSIPVVIAQLGLAPDNVVVSAFEAAFGLKRIGFDDDVDGIIFEGGVNSNFLKTRRILRFRDGTEAGGLAMVNPMDDEAISGIEFATGARPTPHVISLTDWRSAFEAIFPELSVGEPVDDRQDQLSGWANDTTRLKDMESDAPVIRKLDSILTEAVDMGGSDIHVEPAPNATRIRYRVDGRLLGPIEFPPDLAALLASRVKVICDMDVADSRRPQDGRTSVAVRGRPIDLRVSTVPTTYGESIAIRLLDRSASLLDLSTLGFSDAQFNMMTEILEKPKGIFLVTGPTGSGKTTTLYAALNHLRSQQRKILTVEDPIEYFFEDINQVQVNPQAGVSFATALRSFLRQDPDILMVGEIRDAETARIAVQAALTGHLVLSTLHTNDSVSAISRLKDMGIEDYLIAATLSGVTAQRLVRALCPSCRHPVKNGKPKHYQSSGCASCNGEGVTGRIVISEGFLATHEIKELIREGGSEDLIFGRALDQGMKPLLEDGLAKAASGHVMLDDVYVVAGSKTA